MSFLVLEVSLRAKDLFSMGTSGKDIVKRNNNKITHNKEPDLIYVWP